MSMIKKCLILVMCFLLIPAVIFADERPMPPLAVKSAMLVDMNTGRILFQQNSERVIQPASLSKIMSLYLIAEDIENGKADYTDLVTVSEQAVHTNGSKILFEPGEQCEVLDLIKGMAIYSSNDAAVALAEHFGGSVEKFVRRMNAKAREMGMKHTHFINPHGLPDTQQTTTVRDIYILSRNYLKRFPSLRQIHSIEIFVFHDAVLRNRNDLLLSYPGVDGLKTGYVKAAGCHLVATATRGDMRLMAIVLGAKNARIRAQEITKMLDYGFDLVAEKSRGHQSGG
ncbi:MAG TPA: D-alanyl-D-alanine carboxypeptidase family protein [Smithellaceae bacterium]|jgi:serine-type D-Ala-D-Ala carboxypeptidase (penicillin-binding protein 5/6)|nr:D-alanyl-D-alanine carboxypeptidase [Smithella sp.]HNZ11056.1 D-alanyl-D-alanine carboxypeptidase family protein [Smithellaceae bacterium]HOQ42529.1 D-alanyl-D-alanine carboxypeptidase family protein [Smithellaceae bacterium]HPL65137.1 D-alanyl-D-alanine carboxypeptidase family protein [Smithellaceae bacterium]HQP24437.1 D-alanyl-D-alanine carboxypeptidase family protein [Smithellaceae bacterium]